MTDVPGEEVAATVRAQMERLGRDYVGLAASHGHDWPLTAHDPEWPSDCVVDLVGGDRCHWRPVPMGQPPAFARLTRALEVPVHPALCAYFGAQWSASIPVRYLDNDLDLLQLWNTQDFEHLLANLIGHALEKRRIRQPLTLFFALVDDDRLLTLDNDSGAVLLETLGQRRPLEVCATLSQFLAASEVRWPLD